MRQHSGADIVVDFTHFVSTGDLVLSLHALLALADARPIVTLQWLEQSGAASIVIGKHGSLTCVLHCVSSAFHSAYADIACANTLATCGNVLGMNKEHIHVCLQWPRAWRSTRRHSWLQTAKQSERTSSAMRVPSPPPARAACSKARHCCSVWLTI